MAEPEKLIAAAAAGTAVGVYPVTGAPEIIADALKANNICCFGGAGFAAGLVDANLVHVLNGTGTEYAKHILTVSIAAALLGKA